MSKLGKASGIAKKVFLKKEAKQSLKNLYTGYSANKLTTGLVTAGVVGGGLAVVGGGSPKNGVDALLGPTNARTNNMDNLIAVTKGAKKNVQQSMGVVEAPAMTSDAKVDKSLGADGSMLFGMHNKRHG